MSRKPVVLLVGLLACGAPRAVSSDAATSRSDTQMPPPPADSNARLDWALAGPQRTGSLDRFGVFQSNRSRDAFRHPKEMLTFFGITKDMTVVELWPGGGWFTEVLAPFLRDDGKLIVTDQEATSLAGKNWTKAYEDKLRAAPSIYGKVEVRRISPPSDVVLGPAESADMVLTFRNFHNWIKSGYEKAVVDASFKVLKHGGIFGVEEHRGDEGANAKTIADTGYVPEKLVVDLARAAGFELVGSSAVNANPRDDHHHEGGVWALPPNFANGEKDRAKYEAVGESDRMTLKFRKP